MEPKIKLFLSSAQTGEFATEREALPSFFAKQPLSVMFYLWKIEEIPSPNPVGIHYRTNVGSSNGMILLLGQELSVHVAEEYRLSQNRKLPVFAFIKAKAAHSPEMVKFIEHVRASSVTADYHSFPDLVGKLEDALLSHFMRLPHRETNITTTPQSDEEQTLRLLVGIVDSDAAETTKEKVLESLLLETLLRKKEPHSPAELKKTVLAVLPFPGAALEADLEKAIARLATNSNVTSDSGGCFALNEVERNRLKKQFEESEAEENKMFQRFYRRHSSSFASISYDRYKQVVRYSTSQILQENAFRLAHLQLEGDRSSEAYDSDELGRMITSALWKESSLRKGIGQWHSAITEIITDDKPQTVRWLNRQRKVYWLLATLGVDPSFSALRRDYLRRYRIYLDSHIVLRAIVNAGGEYKICADLVRMGKDSGVEMFISDGMFLEVYSAFRSASDTFHKAGRDIARMADIYTHLERKWDILSGYMAACEEYPKLTFDRYLERYYSPVNRAKLYTYIEHELGVHVEPLYDFNTLELEEIDNIRSHLLERRNQQIQAMAPDEQEKFRRLYFLRQNEAKQIAMICKKRAEADSADLQSWFVTFDQFVYEVSLELVKKNPTRYQVPCFMKPANWLEILVNASSGSVAINVFREVFASAAIQHAADLVETQVIAGMLAARMDRHITSLEALREQFADIMNRPAVQGLYKALYSAEADEAKLVEIQKALISELSQEVGKLKKDLLQAKVEAEGVTKEIEKERKKVKYYKAVASSAKLRPKKRRKP
ncbi:MAG: hypothetical protein NTZ09_08780 [Candidatus Hydrogenedentes bacterium]|nr:hypothetical protein [Candidatus Hydrogenedentota bacterium]